MKNYLFRSAGILAFGAIVAINDVSAASVEFGNPSFSGNSFPFTGDGFDVNTRYQQIYDGDKFSGPMAITSVTFFNSVLPGAVFENADYTISLSTSPKTVNSLDTSNFGNNLGADNALFLAVHLAGGTGPTVTFIGTPFNYDPTLGDLLVDIQRANAVPGSGSGFLDARNGDFGTDSSRAHNFGTGFESFGLRTRFDGDALTAPDSGSMALLLGSSVGGLLVFRRKYSK